MKYNNSLRTSSLEVRKYLEKWLGKVLSYLLRIRFLLLFSVLLLFSFFHFSYYNFCVVPSRTLCCTGRCDTRRTASMISPRGLCTRLRNKFILKMRRHWSPPDILVIYKILYGQIIFAWVLMFDTVHYICAVFILVFLFFWRMIPPYE